MALNKEIVDYKYNQREIEYLAKLKGEYKYQEILDFYKKRNMKCNWIIVKNTMEYNEKLLFVLFKYFIHLDSFLKSVLSKETDLSSEAISKQKFSESLDSFNDLIKDQFEKVDYDKLLRYGKCLSQLRSSVTHNKLVIFKKFSINETNVTLDELLDVFKNVLPDVYRQSYVKEINEISIGISNCVHTIRLEN